MEKKGSWRELTEKYWKTFSFVGLVTGTLLFAGSLTPTLLPRHYAVQGVLSGLAFAMGYAIGVTGVLVWLFLEIPQVSGSVQRWSKWISSAAVVIVAIWFLWWDKVWQDSIRERMAMPPSEVAYPWRVATIALITAVTAISVARGLRWLWRQIDRQIKRVVPRRVSYLLSLSVVAMLVLLLVNNGKRATEPFVERAFFGGSKWTMERSVSGRIWFDLVVPESAEGGRGCAASVQRSRFRRTSRLACLASARSRRSSWRYVRMNSGCV